MGFDIHFVEGRTGCGAFAALHAFIRIDSADFTDLFRSVFIAHASVTSSFTPRDVKPGKLIDAARQIVEREKGGNYLSPDEIPSLLDPELPQQLLVSAFRRYRR